MAAVLTAESRNAVGAEQEPPVTAVVSFNLDPAGYAHRSWLPLPMRRAGGSVRAAASAWLLREHALQADTDWSPRGPLQHVFLGAPSWFASLSLELGAALRREALAQAIDGVVQRRLRALPGVDAEAMRFALLNAPRNAGSASLDGLLRSPSRAAMRLRREGGALLLSLLDAHNTAVSVRARLRLPRGLVPAVLDEAQRQAWTGYLFNRLLPARFTPWLWLS
jgi:hypothetical protein